VKWEVRTIAIMRKCIVLLYVFVGLCVLGCSSQAPEKTSFVIARSMQWRAINMGGFEKNVIGFSDDVLFAIGRARQLQLSIIENSATSILSLLDNPKIDGVLTVIEPTEQLGRDYVFSESCFVFGTVLLVKKNSTCASFQEMSGRDVGFVRGDLLLFRQVENINPNICPYDNLEAAIDDLMNGNIDSVVAEVMQARKFLTGAYRDKLRVVGQALYPLGLKVAVKKGKNESLIAAVNAGLTQIKKEGLYAKILAYWNLSDLFEVLPPKEKSTK
jgi:polar amino acid transport system substrate-binding protein